MEKAKLCEMIKIDEIRLQSECLFWTHGRAARGCLMKREALVVVLVMSDTWIPGLKLLYGACVLWFDGQETCRKIARFLGDVDLVISVWQKKGPDDKMSKNIVTVQMTKEWHEKGYKSMTKVLGRCARWERLRKSRFVSSFRLLKWHQMQLCSLSFFVWFVW